MTGNDIQLYGEAIRFKIGDYFFYHSERVHRLYGPHVVLGKIVKIEESKTQDFGISLFYQQILCIPQSIFPNDMMDFTYFNLNSPMGKGAIICNEEEVKMMEMLYG